MRKHSYFPAPAAAIAAIGLIASLAACSRESRSQAGTEASKTVATDMVASDALMPQAAREEQAMSVATPAAAPPPVMGTQAGNGAAMGRARRDGSARQISFGSGLLPPAIDAAGAMLVRTGEAAVEVTRVAEALGRIRQTATQFGGIVGNTALRNGRDEEPSATLEIRVPSAQFDALVNALSAIGKVESVSASVQDVGEEYVDLGARAANAKRMESRLVELLATRTGRLSDILQVEHELQRVREEIERYDARLRFLERRASMSTLAVTLHEPIGIMDRRQPSPIANAFGLAWERTLGFMAWCIAALGVIVPLGLLVAGGFVIVRRMRWRGGTSRGESAATV